MGDRVPSLPSEGLAGFLSWADTGIIFLPVYDARLLPGPKMSNPVRSLLETAVYAVRGALVAEGRSAGVLRRIDFDLVYGRDTPIEKCRFKVEQVLVDGKNLAEVSGCAPTKLFHGIIEKLLADVLNVNYNSISSMPVEQLFGRKIAAIPFKTEAFDAFTAHKKIKLEATLPKATLGPFYELIKPS